MKKSGGKLIRNDTPWSEEEVHRRLVDGVDISYGDVTFTVERRALEDARKEIAEVPSEERQRAMRSIDKALPKNLEIAETEAKAGKATKELMDECFKDMVVWTVLQEFK